MESEIRFFFMKDASDMCCFVLNRKKPLLKHVEEPYEEWPFYKAIIQEDIPSLSEGLQLMEVDFYKEKRCNTDIPVILYRSENNNFDIYFNLIPIYYNGEKYYQVASLNVDGDTNLGKDIFNNRSHWHDVLLDDVKVGYNLFYLHTAGASEAKRSWLTYDNTNGYALTMGTCPYKNHFDTITLTNEKNKCTILHDFKWEKFHFDICFDNDEICNIEIEHGDDPVEVCMSLEPENAIAKFVLTKYDKDYYSVKKEQEDGIGKLITNTYAPFELEMGESKTVYIHKK